MTTAQSFDTAEIYSLMALEVQGPEPHRVDIWVLVWLGSSGRMQARGLGSDHRFFQLLVAAGISCFSKPAAYHCFSESAFLSFYHMAIAFLIVHSPLSIFL